MKNTFKKNIVLPAVALVALTGVGTGILSYAHASNADTVATTTTATSSTQPTGQRGPGVMGTVASVSGTTITLTGKDGTTYTVDASGATFKKSASGAEPTTVSISSIAVGDTVGIRGTVSGSSVTATEVMDGMMMGGGHGGFGGRGPGVTGTVSAINGNTITITNTNGTTYTVDASSAQVSKMQTLSVSDIAVGDTIGVQGTTSGTSVTAERIMDGVPAAPAQAAPAAASATTTQ